MLPIHCFVKENWWDRINIQTTQKQIEHGYFWQLRGGRVGSVTADFKDTRVKHKQQNDQK